MKSSSSLYASKPSMRHFLLFFVPHIAKHSMFRRKMLETRTIMSQTSHRFCFEATGRLHATMLLLL